MAASEYILGLDIGSASIGWALIGLDSFHNPNTVVRTGVRIFEPGVEGSALEIERGKDQSKAVARKKGKHDSTVGSSGGERQTTA